MVAKSDVFDKVQGMLDQLGFAVTKKDDTRPWGGFFVIDEGLAAAFAAHFFPEEEADSWQLFQKLSPKILIVSPGARLSWQYHHRRAEIWKCISDEVAVITSDTDVETEKQILRYGEVIHLHQGQRHRLIGSADWGIVAEIWKHTQPDHPSDEDDIVRVQDDFGR
jgi:mannose-6-phosphate isomerase-like protein (cupin superfamily)